MKLLKIMRYKMSYNILILIIIIIFQVLFTLGRPNASTETVTSSSSTNSVNNPKVNSFGAKDVDIIVKAVCDLGVSCINARSIVIGTMRNNRNLTNGEIIRLIMANRSTTNNTIESKGADIVNNVNTSNISYTSNRVIDVDFRMV